MDGGSDVSLAIRRAKRSGASAKRLDLSCRGLRAWPKDLFSLPHLEALDLSSNELSSVDPGIAQLVQLQELDLSNNRLERLPELDLDALANLRSLVLEGNPVASRLPSTLVRQLARPPSTAGRTAAQVIRSLLEGADSAPAARRPSPTPPETKEVDKVDEVMPFEDVEPSPPLRRPSPAPPHLPASEAALRRPGTRMPDRSPGAEAPVLRSSPRQNAVEAARRRAEDEDADEVQPWRPEPKAPKPPAAQVAQGAEEAQWRQQQKALLAEVEQLRARVKELEAEAQLSAGGFAKSASSTGGLPSWLQQESRQNVRLNSTLPSRMGSLGDNDEAAALKEQLREEQRRSKRLEQEVTRLEHRLKERELVRTGVGSVPHFDFSEVELGDLINQGGFSVVHKGLWHTTKVAVKKLFDPNITAELLAEFDNEVQKLEQIRHPNILMLLAVHRKPPALSLIMELVEGGSFYQLLHSPNQFNGTSGPATGVTFQESMEILDSTGTAIAFLHARGIAHRDVKTQNVLLSPTLEVKLCDFGLARMRSELMTGSMQFAGTPNYMAPEIFRNQKYSENVDVFAFGTVLWEAMAVDIPFANLDPGDIRDRVLEGRMLPMPTAAPPGIQALIQACWTADRNARPGMAEVLSQLRDCKDGGSPKGSGACGRAGRERRHLPCWTST